MANAYVTNPLTWTTEPTSMRQKRESWIRIKKIQ